MLAIKKCINVCVLMIPIPPGTRVSFCCIDSNFPKPTAAKTVGPSANAAAGATATADGTGAGSRPGSRGLSMAELMSGAAAEGTPDQGAGW